jgi:hypothetical protein
MRQPAAHYTLLSMGPSVLQIEAYGTEGEKRHAVVTVCVLSLFLDPAPHMMSPPTPRCVAALPVLFPVRTDTITVLNQLLLPLCFRGVGLLHLYCHIA